MGDSGAGDGQGEERPPHEPAVRAPAPALTLSMGLIALYIGQGFFGDVDAAATRFGFAPVDLALGRWGGLVTALFVHGSWVHVLLNAGGALAFGSPVARFLGRGPGGWAAFAAFFLTCGVLGSLGFAAVHQGGEGVLIGASGAVSGLMGAASRLIEWRVVLAPLRSRLVLGMAAAWLVVNVALGLVTIEVLTGDAGVAWEAHIAGYAAGLLLIGPLARLLGRGRTVTPL